MPGNHTFSQSGWWQQAPFLALFSHLFGWFFPGLRVSSHTFPDQYFAEYSRGTFCTSLGFSLSSPALCLEKSPHLSFPRLSYVSSIQELPGIHLGLPMCTAAWKLFLGSQWGDIRAHIISFPVLGESLSFITHPVSRVLLGSFGCFRQENKSDPCSFIFGRSTCLSIRFCCITKLHPKCSGLTIFFFAHIGQVGTLGQVVLLVLAELIPGSAVSDEPAGGSASWAFAGY